MFSDFSYGRKYFRIVFLYYSIFEADDKNW